MLTPAFAVVATRPHFCVSTDAYQGKVSWVAARAATKSEAERIGHEMFGVADEDFDPAYHAEYKVEIRPFREGEGDSSWKGYSLLELSNDAWARDELERQVSVSGLTEDMLW